MPSLTGMAQDASTSNFEAGPQRHKPSRPRHGFELHRQLPSPNPIPGESSRLIAVRPVGIIWYYFRQVLRWGLYGSLTHAHIGTEKG